MSLPLIVNPEAETDLAEAWTWYEGRRAGLGDDFLLCVEEAFDGIRRSPGLYATVFQDLRLAMVRRFPFQIIHRVDVNQVTIIAVYHSSRDPRGWLERLP